MNVLKVVGSLFGLGGDKGIVEKVSDTAERWAPSEVKKHEMNIDKTKAEDASQASARAYEPKEATSKGVFILDLFNTILDCLNRLPRPILALWATGLLIGIIPEPGHLNYLHPIIFNIVWTVVGFYFGIRTISQDLPQLIKTIRGK